MYEVPAFCFYSITKLELIIKLDGKVKQSYEPFRFWQHLSLAKFIKGEYNGFQDSFETEDNYPILFTSRVTYGFSENFTNKNASVINTSFHAFGLSQGAKINDENMLLLDTKYDDANLESGKIMVWQIIYSGSAPDCLNGTTNPTYDIMGQKTFTDCQAIFVN